MLFVAHVNNFVHKLLLVTQVKTFTFKAFADYLKNIVAYVNKFDYAPLHVAQENKFTYKLLLVEQAKNHL